MNIALDATPLSIPQAGGIARYTDELARALAREFPEDQFWLVSDQRFPCIAGGLQNLRCGRAPGNAIERRWWSCGLPAELSRTGADIFHGTDFAVPYRGTCPSVMTVHDLSPWREATAGQTSRRVRRRAGILLKLRRPTIVITPTNAIRSEFLERFRRAGADVVAVPLAAADIFRPCASAGETRPYFLHVGTIVGRKNIGTVLGAWRTVRQHHVVDLVLAGTVRDRTQLPAREPGLIIREDADDACLARLYSGALACLMPTYYEGFGLPILESMQCGCPVVASRDPALMEVSGGAAEHVDALDAAGWRVALERLCTDAQLRSELRERGLRRAAAFSWARTARLTREVYAEAFRRQRR